VAKPTDIVWVAKWESAAHGGSAEDDFPAPTQIESEEDGIAAAGIYGAEAGKDGEDRIVCLYREGDEWFFEDTNYSGENRKSLADLASGSGMTPAQHRALDQLVHEIADSSYLEVTRTAGKVSAITYWTDSGKTIKIREVVITRDGNGKVSQTVETQYDAAGAPITGEILTTTITRSGGKVENMTMVRS